MKCIKQSATNKIVRTNDQAAGLMVSTGDWKYVPKTEWKLKVRDSKLTHKEKHNGESQKDIPSS